MAYRCYLGDRDGAVERAMALLRFGSDVQAVTSRSNTRSTAVHSVAFLVREVDLTPRQAGRLIPFLQAELRREPPLESVVTQVSHALQESCLRLARKDPLLLARDPSAYHRPDGVLSEVDGAIGIGYQPHEIESAWRRVREEFGLMARHARRGDDISVVEGATRYFESLDASLNPVERRFRWNEYFFVGSSMEMAATVRLQLEATLLSLLLREQWRETGVRPVSVEEARPPEVRRKPSGRIWILSHEAESGALSLDWGSDIDEIWCWARVRPPRPTRSR